jgi:hypothetical protein
LSLKDYFEKWDGGKNSFKSMTPTQRLAQAIKHTQGIVMA